MVGLGPQYSVPVRHVEESNYLIGVKIVKAEITGPNVVLRVGGGFETIEMFIERYRNESIREIVTLQRQHKKSLSWVIDQYVAG